MSLLSPTDNGDDRSESILAENHVDSTGGMLSGASSRKPIKTGMKELAVMREKVNEQQRQMGKVGKVHHNHEDSKKSRMPTGRVRGGGGGGRAQGYAECKSDIYNKLPLKEERGEGKKKKKKKSKRLFWPEAEVERTI